MKTEQEIRETLSVIDEKIRKDEWKSIRQKITLISYREALGYVLDENILYEMEDVNQ